MRFSHLNKIRKRRFSVLHGPKSGSHEGPWGSELCFLGSPRAVIVPVVATTNTSIITIFLISFLPIVLALHWKNYWLFQWRRDNNPRTTEKVWKSHFNIGDLYNPLLKIGEHTLETQQEDFHGWKFPPPKVDDTEYWWWVLAFESNVIVNKTRYLLGSEFT